MAPKARPPSSPSSSSSSSAADSASSSSSSDAEPPPPKPSQTPLSPSKKPPPNPKNPPPPAAAAASSDSSSESDSDSPPSAANPPPPAAAAATPTAAASNSGDSDDASSGPPPPPSRRPSRPSAAKSPLPKALHSSTKPPPATPEKRKSSDPPLDDNGPSAKKLFQRIWSPEDEIAVLEGALEFQARNGNSSDPLAAGDPFYQFLRNSRKLELSKSQIADKLRRLKKKFHSNLKRCRNGADPTFAKDHERLSFELSKRIWSLKESSGEEDGSEGEDEPRKLRKTSHFGGNYPNLKEAMDLVEKEGWGGIAGGSLVRALERLKPARAKAIEERWGKHFIAGAKFMLEREELKKDLIKTLVGVMDGSVA